MTTDDEQRHEVALASRVLAAAGHADLVWGHVSVRDHSGRGCWIKSARWGLGEVQPGRVHLAGPAGDLLAGPGPVHNELPIHSRIYATRTDVGSVVHTHAPHAVALAASGRPLLPVGHAATMFVPPAVPVFAATTDLIVDDRLGDELAATLGGLGAALLRNHGLVTVGADVREATVRAVTLERACHQQLLTAGFGAVSAWTGDDEALAKRARIHHRGSIDAVWAHLVRTLPDAALTEG